MEAKVGYTYDDGLVRRTVMEANYKRVRVISRWKTKHGEASHQINFTREKWDEWFKGRKVTITK